MSATHLIRFRAWDTQRQMMLIPAMPTLNAVCPTAGVITWGPGCFAADGENYIFMQFTGLCDRHGTELYEGDLCAHSKYHDTYEVFWSDAGFSVRSKTHTCLLSSLCQQYLEILGNIYANPELVS